MNDRDLMEGILLTTKGAIDLYMHGAVESATPNIQQSFCSALNDAITMQSDIYRQMSAHGWYTAEQEQPQKIQQVRDKFTGIA